MENGKKTVVWVSDYPALRTGLAKSTRYVLEFLYKTGKYNIVCFAHGASWSNPDFERFPYELKGCLPNTQEELNHILSQHPPENKEGVSRMISYGQLYIDKIVKEYKPDALILSNDFWAFSSYEQKPWFNKFPSILHVTIDSYPLTEEAIKQAAATPYYFTWLNFAKDWMHQAGQKHVKTISGAIDPTPFYKQSFSEKVKLREKFNIPKDAKVFGFVFRNQIRKLIFPLLEGFKLFLDKHPEENPYLLIQTSWSEGWNIPSKIKQLNLDNNRVLTNFICKNCGEIHIRPFEKQDIDCPYCKVTGSAPNQQNPNGNGMVTCNSGYGCTDDQLNDVYNLMDSYYQIVDSGGLELCIIEALYCEIPVATINYSYGEDFINGKVAIAVDHQKTWQLETSFEKAVPNIFSIYKTMKKFCDMKKDKIEEIGKFGRAWAIERFSPEKVGKQWEDLLDSLPENNYKYDWDEKAEEKDPNAIIDNSIISDSEWVEQLYNKILKRPSDENGKNDWLSTLSQGNNRPGVEATFRQIAAQENQKNKQVSLEDIFGHDTKKEDRILFIIPESLGDCLYASCLLTELRSLYPDKKIFLSTKPQFFEFFQPLLGTLIDSIISWNPIFNNALLLESQHVLVNYIVTAPTQCFLNYTRNGQDRSNLSLELTNKEL